MSAPFWLTIPQFDRSFDAIRELALGASGLGLSGLFCFDHLIPIGNPARPTLEGAATLGAIAAVSTVPIGSLVTRVTLRPPEVTAALSVTLSDVGGAGAVLGLGVGDRMSEDEAVRFGMDQPKLSARLGLLERTIALVRQSNPGLRVWLGGRHPRVREAAARLADGWNAWGVDVEAFASEAAEVRANAVRAVTISWGGGVLLAPDEGALEREVAKRGSREGLIAGTPRTIVSRLAPIAGLADQMVISVLPNRPDNWQLFANEVLGQMS